MLDNHSPIPLYYQLKAHLEEQIEHGIWKAGERVPSESELGDLFGVSRTTVRQALGDLVQRGLLTRVQGRGTFVAEPRLQQPLMRLTGFTQDMRAWGKSPSSQVLQVGLAAAEPETALALGVPPGSPVILVKRLRIADGHPLALEIAHLAHPLCRGVLSEDLGIQSLYQILAARLHIVPTRAEQRLEAVRCPAAEAHLLGIARGEPVLHIHRTTFDQHGRAFEQVESFYRGDRYAFHAELIA